MSSLLEQLLAVTAAGPSSDAQAQAQLAHGREMLARGQREAAAVALRAAALAPATRLQAHNLIEQHRLTGCFGDWMGLDARIDPADDVYGFFTGHGSWSSPLRDYLADGWRTLSKLMLLLERSGRALTDCATVLEFASGHGRFTRHLVKALGADRVTVSDVVPGAVEFARATFGVQAFVGVTTSGDALPGSLRSGVRVVAVFILPRPLRALAGALVGYGAWRGAGADRTTIGHRARRVSVMPRVSSWRPVNPTRLMPRIWQRSPARHFAYSWPPWRPSRRAWVTGRPGAHQDAWVLERPLSVAGGAS